MTAEKKLLGSVGGDSKKILPIKYTWARQHYKNSVRNNWTPEEISMQKDVEQWQASDILTENERHLIMWNLGFFSIAESLTANNIVLAMYRHVTNAECRQYMLRQAYEEAVHTDTFLYCCDSLSLDSEEIFAAYKHIPSITAKDEFVANMTKTIFDPTFEINTTEDKQAFLLDVIGYYMIMKGVFFYAGFAMMLQLMRDNKMKGIGEQFQYILRDEMIHIAYGRDLIDAIVAENPEIWTEDFKNKVADLFRQATTHELAYVEDCLPFASLGLTSDTLKQYVRHIVDRRCEMIHLPILFGDENPFPWMNEIIDLKKEKNFFDTQVNEYQSAGNLEW